MENTRILSSMNENKLKLPLFTDSYTGRCTQVHRKVYTGTQEGVHRYTGRCTCIERKCADLLSLQKFITGPVPTPRGNLGHGRMAELIQLPNTGSSNHTKIIYVSGGGHTTSSYHGNSGSSWSTYWGGSGGGGGYTDRAPPAPPGYKMAQDPLTGQLFLVPGMCLFNHVNVGKWF